MHFMKNRCNRFYKMANKFNKKRKVNFPEANEEPRVKIMWVLFFSPHR